MILKLKDAWKKLQMIPLDLRAFTICMLVLGPVLVMVSFSPSWTYEDGETISFKEAWLSGFELFVFVYGVLMVLTGVLIYKKWRYIRHFLMIGVLSVALSPYSDLGYADVPTSILIPVSVFTVFIGGWYLYCKKTVVRYFTFETDKQNKSVVSRANFE